MSIAGSFLTTLLFVFCAFASDESVDPTVDPAGPTATPGVSISPDTRQPSTPGQDSVSLQDLTRPIFLSGKVILEDGTPPPETIVIQRVCGIGVKPEAYTDSKGRFSFQLGQNTSVITDASVGPDVGHAGLGGFNSRDLAGCALRASLPGFRSDEIPLTAVRPMERSGLGTIVLHRYGNVEGTTISMASLQAPKEAKKAFDNGRKAIEKKKWAEAKLELEKAVGLYPQYATAWCDLGRTLEESGNIPEARKAYAQALAVDTKFVTPYLHLATISAKEGDWRDVADITDRVVKSNPGDFPGIYLFNAIANYNLKEFAAAEQSAREALKLDAQQHRFPQANHILGVILARKGEYTEAAVYMKTYIQIAPGASDIARVRKQLVEVEKSAQAGAGFPH